MPVMSYLAYSAEGQKTTLVAALQALPHCEVLPADNRDVVVLITDTMDKEEERILQEQLRDVASLQCLTLVSGYDEQAAAEIDKMVRYETQGRS